MLSREYSPKEVSWSLAEYQDADELRAAFKLTMPLPKSVGVYANQVNPWEERHRGVCRLFWKMAGIALLLQLAFVFVLASTLLKHKFVASPSAGESSALTPEFVLKGTARTLTVRHKTDIDNNWLSLSTTLVDKGHGQGLAGHAGDRALQRCRWRRELVGRLEGRRDRLQRTCRPVPISSTSTTNSVPTACARWSTTSRSRRMPRLVQFRARAHLPGGLPLFSRSRRAAFFETRRWASALYAPVDSDDGDSDGGGDD